MKVLVALIGGAFAAAANAATDFGVRTVEQGLSTPAVHVEQKWAAKLDLRHAARIGSDFGRVTSLRRSAEHNRRVGGVRNSYHLVGRAIDVARAPGVTHAALERAYRQAGYRIIESLDEGDHSHFAFGDPRVSRPVVRQQTAASTTNWGLVLAPK